MVPVVAEELGRRRVECDGDAVAVTGLLGRVQNRFDRTIGRIELGCEPALVADAGCKTTLVQDALERMEDLRPDAQALGERLRAGRHDHELLQVERVLRVRAAVDHVHHRDRQDMSTLPADPAEERHACIRRARFRGGERHAQDRVRAQPRLVLRAVKVDQRNVERSLIVRVEAADGLRNLARDVAHGVQGALAAVDRLVAVAQLDRLELPGRRARRHGRATGRAGLEHDLHLDRRVAAGVEDLPGMHAGDRGSGYRNSSFARSK